MYAEKAIIGSMVADTNTATRTVIVGGPLNPCQLGIVRRMAVAVYS